MQVEIDVRVHPLPVMVIMRSGAMIFRVVPEPRYPGKFRHQRGKLWRAYVVVEFGIHGADISHIVPREFFAARPNSLTIFVASGTGNCRIKSDTTSAAKKFSISTCRNGFASANRRLSSAIFEVMASCRIGRLASDMFLLSGLNDLVTACSITRR